MAWSPSPEVAVARDAARKLGAQQVAIIYILPDGRFGMASYGETQALCAEMGKLGDHLFGETERWCLRSER